MIVICCGCAGGATQYTCYYMDDAIHVDFNNALPNWLTVVLNVLRFTSLSHVLCGYSHFFVLSVCVMIVSQLSMKEFKGKNVFHIFRVKSSRNHFLTNELLVMNVTTFLINVNLACCLSNYREINTSMFYTNILFQLQFLWIKNSRSQTPT